MKRNASAVWRGTGKEGSGNISTASGALKDQPYSAHMRFESQDGKAGTNPEELIAAAHAGCFTMATAFNLTNAGFKPDELSTTADLTMEKLEPGWTVTAIHLTLRGKVPGATAAQFEELANKAKVGCPISRLLKAEITLDAKLV
jgi:osmotically inducible protein OsmC